jgi:hypothetical protein
VATLTRESLSTWDRGEIADLSRSHPEHVPASGTLLLGGASPHAISALETRLEVSLPPSYRDFLALSNGTHTVWSLTNVPDEPVPSWLGLWSCEYVDWFAKRHRDWIDIWTVNVEEQHDGIPDDVYFDYTLPQDSFQVRVEHLDGALQIAGCRQGEVLLLNPHAQSSDGEWEFWYFGIHIAGAYRLKSFADFFEPRARAAVTTVGMPV